MIPHQVFVYLAIFLLLFSSTALAEEVPLEFRLVKNSPCSGCEKAPSLSKSAPAYLEAKPSLTFTDVSSVSVDTKNASTYVQLTLTPKGEEKFAEITSQNIGKRLALIYNGEILSAPVIRETIKGGRASVTFKSRAQVKSFFDRILR